MEEDLDEDILYINFSQKFRAIRILGNECYITNWTLRANVYGELFGEDEIDNLNIATMKVKFWFDNIVNDSIIFAKSNDWAVSAFLSDNDPLTDTNIILVPDDPTDDKLALVFQAKMNALGNPVGFSDIELESDNARGLSFTYVGETDRLLPSIEDWTIAEHLGQPWWNRDDASTFDSPNLTAESIFDLNFLVDTVIPPVPRPTTSAKIIKPEFRVIEGKKKDE